jgi:hypothetical protein
MRCCVRWALSLSEGCAGLRKLIQVWVWAVWMWVWVCKYNAVAYVCFIFVSIYLNT